MRVFNFIDVNIQSALFALALIETVLTMINGDHGNLEITILYIGMCLGGWQLFSSVVGSLARSPYNKFRIAHLVMSGIYLAFFFAGVRAFGEMIAVAVPMMLAVYCYWITVLTFRTTRAIKKAVR